MYDLEFRDAWIVIWGARNTLSTGSHFYCYDGEFNFWTRVRKKGGGRGGKTIMHKWWDKRTISKSLIFRYPMGEEEEEGLFNFKKKR